MLILALQNECFAEKQVQNMPKYEFFWVPNSSVTATKKFQNILSSSVIAGGIYGEHLSQNRRIDRTLLALTWNQGLQLWRFRAKVAVLKGQGRQKFVAIRHAKSGDFGKFVENLQKVAFFGQKMAILTDFLEKLLVCQTFQN